MNIKQHTKAKIDKAIALPEELTCKDGRKFLITKWRPCVTVDGVDTALIEVDISLPEDVE